MDVLFIVPYVPTPIRTRPYNLIRALARRGHRVTVATLWEDAAERIVAALLEHESTIESRPLGAGKIEPRRDIARRVWQCLELPRR
jgi:hypothetical protein